MFSFAMSGQFLSQQGISFLLQPEDEIHYKHRGVFQQIIDLTTMPRKGCPRKWLFNKRQLISRSERTVCLLYSTKENIKLCWQYTTDIRYDGLQPGTCLTEEMVQHQMCISKHSALHSCTNAADAASSWGCKFP